MARSTVPAGELLEEAADGLDDVVLLVFSQFGEHRQRECFAGGAFGFGEVAFLVAEVAEAVLQVERDGIMNFGADAVLCEVRGERVALAVGDADDVLVEDVHGAGADVKGRDEFGESGLSEQTRVEGGAFAARLRPAVEVRELDAQERGLDGVEAAVEAPTSEWWYSVSPPWTRSRRRRSARRSSSVVTIPASPAAPRFLVG